MQIDKTQYDALSHKAVKVLGQEKIEQMSDPQINLLDRALGRVLLRHKGNVNMLTASKAIGLAYCAACPVWETTPVS